jgi:myosin heavy subunit
VSRRSRTEADNGAGADTDTTINILDIFGFEAFRTNGFEQVG